LQPVGAVANAPTKDVKCLDKDGSTLTKVALADIENAGSLAQAGPLQKSVKGKKNQIFPASFRQ
jgi:hypothetical protein